MRFFAMLKLTAICYFITIFLISKSRSNFRSHPNWPKRFEKICGESYTDRIIGGKSAALGQFPWIARLVSRDQLHDLSSTNCGGSLITDRHVVSAAHCLKEEIQKLVSVILGEYNILTNPDCDEDMCSDRIQTIKIASFSIPPTFNKRQMIDDISLITLQTPAKLTEWVMPICLPTGLESFGRSAVVAGWGYFTTYGDQPNILQFVRVPVVKLEECQKWYKKPYYLGERVICAGTESQNEDSCNGDSGGPLMQVALNEYGPRYYLTGVVSYGQKLCGVAPGVYTNVIMQLPFILNAIKT